jgi:hypothetical protein
MSKRTILMFVLSMLTLLGLVAGLFTGSIENALGMSQGTQTMITTHATQPTPIQKVIGTNNTHSSPAMQSAGTMQANAVQPNQQDVLSTDTFQRQNQNLWGTASDGRQWEGDANTQPYFSISGLTGRIAGGQGALNAVIGLPTDDVDITVSGIVNQFGDSVNLGAILRWTDTNNWYKALIDGDHLKILKSINGQTTTIAQINMQTSAGVAQTLRFRSLGSMLFAKAWSSGTPEPQKWMLIADDQTFTTGRFGIRVFEESTTVINIMSFTATIASMDNDT